ncbi:D-2-hydroxyacid dehydrogenase [Ihubacter massiliensis]|uniref:NAD(P)-dependent oxidoreductase n=1 Tax=Ihubacter massiliensis TaxID=1852367 RepID=UPI0020975C22|nr:NAD(P)-dependent oxidoreductase [Ihubacter massiliensis]MCO7121556.1 D-2-hydroxyacid dehydrogenase [Ihubacter massiliensis]
MRKEDFRNWLCENPEIVILDENIITKDGLSWECLKEFGELTVFHNTPPELVAKRCKDADIILTSKCVISRSVMEVCPKLKYIGVLATGYNMVDLEYAKEKAITVTNVPAYSTASVAQFTISMILMLAVHAEQHAQAVKEGMWLNSKEFCLHCPLTKENEGFVNQAAISKMKNGVMIVNAARGRLINETDLAENLKNGKITAAALDVLSVEPAQEDNALLAAPNCFITPHMAWATREARERLIKWTYDNLAAFLQGEALNRIA